MGKKKRLKEERRQQKLTTGKQDAAKLDSQAATFNEVMSQVATPANRARTRQYTRVYQDLLIGRPGM